MAKKAVLDKQSLLYLVPNDFNLVEEANKVKALMKDYELIFDIRPEEYWGSDPLIPQTKEHFEDMLHHLSKHNDISVDTETGGLSLVNPAIQTCGYVFTTDEKSFYVPIRHNTKEPQINDELFLHTMRNEFFNRKDLVLNFHNFAFDFNFLLKDGIDLTHMIREGRIWDTQIMEWLLDENQKDDPWYYMPQVGRPAIKTKWKSGLNGHAVAAGKAGAKLMQGFSLKVLAPKKYGVPMTKFDELMEHFGFPNLPIHFGGKYARVDGIATQKLKREGAPKIKSEKLETAFFKVEMPYTLTIAHMQRRGMGVNLRALERMEERVTEEIETLTDKLFSVTGPMKFSAKQLSALFHEKLGLPVLAQTAKGNPQFNAEAFELYETFLEENKNKFPAHVLELPNIIIRIKKLEKINGTYLKSIRVNIDVDGRIHCSLHQTGTVTGRLSSSDPNLQNMPSKPVYVDELNKEQMIKLRQQYGDLDLGRMFDFSVHFLDAEGESLGMSEGWEEKCVKVVEKWGFRDLYSEMEFTPENRMKYKEQYPLFGLVAMYISDIGTLTWIDLCDDDWLYLVGDYSQMELRMMAHLSNAKSLIAAFMDGVDPHKKTAADVNGVPLEQVTKDQRQGAKAVNFGTIYGKTEYGFAVDWYSHESDFWVDSTWNPTGKEPAKKYLELTRQFLRKFFDANPDVENYILKRQEDASKNGYVRSITGRKRRLPDVFSEKTSEKNRAKRQAVNSIDQGSSADYLKIAMNNIEEASTPLYEAFPLYQLLTVHDEVITLVRKKDLGLCETKFTQLMTTAVSLRCPIETDPAPAYKYGSAK